MAGADVQITVGPDVIRPIIEAKIHGAIVNELSKGPELVEAVVKRVLEMKVDSNGQPDRYNDSRSPTYIEWVVNSAIKQSTMAAVKTMVESQQDKIEEAIGRALTKNRGIIAANLVAALVKNATDRYNVKVDTSFTVAGRD